MIQIKEQEVPLEDLDQVWEEMVQYFEIHEME